MRRRAAIEEVFLAADVEDTPEAIAARWEVARDFFQNVAFRGVTMAEIWSELRRWDFAQPLVVGPPPDTPLVLARIEDPAPIFGLPMGEEGERLYRVTPGTRYLWGVRLPPGLAGSGYVPRAEPHGLPPRWYIPAARHPYHPQVRPL